MNQIKKKKYRALNLPKLCLKRKKKAFKRDENQLHIETSQKKEDYDMQIYGGKTVWKENCISETSGWPWKYFNNIDS